MNARCFRIPGAAVPVPWLPGITLADEIKHPFVRIAEIEIQPAQLKHYDTALTPLVR